MSLSNFVRGSHLKAASLRERELRNSHARVTEPDHGVLEEILRVLPYWPRDRYLELAPKYWPATRGRLRPAELAAPISAFEVPPPLGEAVELVAAPSA